MSIPPLYDTFLIREPLRDDPFAVTHNPSDIPTLIEVYSTSISYFTEHNRERAVERLQYELALLYTREQKWKKALRCLMSVYEGSSWRREGWWNLLGLLREQVRDVARTCDDPNPKVVDTTGSVSLRPYVRVHMTKRGLFTYVQHETLSSAFTTTLGFDEIFFMPSRHFVKS